MIDLFSYFPAFLRPVALLAAAVLSLCAALPARGEDDCRVVVVRSAQLQPHLDVVRGLKEASACTVREVTLRDDEGPDRIMDLSPDFVVTVGTSGLRKLKDIRAVPLIYAMAVPSEALRCDAPNISGVSMDLSPASHFASMRAVYPEKKRVGVIYDPRQTGAFLEEALKAAPAAGLELVSLKVQDPSKLPAALASLESKVDIFWMLPDATVVTAENLDLMLRFSFRSRVPIFTFSRKYVEMGAVVSVDLDPYDIGVQVAELAKRLNSGSGPARQYARRPHLTFNRTVAGKMGFPISEETMKKAKSID